MNINPEVLSEIRNLVKDKIHSVEICIDGQWHAGTIQNISIDSDTVGVVATFGNIADQEFTATAVRITDSEGNMVAEHIQNYSKTVNSGLYISIKIPIKEV